MFEGSSARATLDRTVVRICPACGVVNPSGPALECPHLQLARFDGLGAELSGLLSQVAEARRRFADLQLLIKSAVMQALKEGRAVVETTRKVRASELERVLQRGEGASLNLTHPEVRTAGSPRPPVRARRRSTGQPPVDPRQLELLAKSPPKGDA